MKNPFKFAKQSDSHDEASDLGLGGRFRGGFQRVLRKDGSFNIRRIGVVKPLFDRLIALPWWLFFIYTALIYVAVNVLFATVYFLLGVDQININEYPADSFDAFLSAFHFSAQTLTTVGYGFYHPINGPAAFVATFEAFVGLLSFAFATGLLYGRFSRPRSGLIFSDKAILIEDEEQGKNGFMLRIANGHSSSMIEVRAQLIFTWMEEGSGGLVRQYRQLALERNSVSMLPLNWTLVHWIDDESPLAGKSLMELKAMHGEFICIIKAFNETFSQEVHSRTSYTADEVVENQRFKIPYKVTDDGQTVFDLEQLSETLPM